MKFRDFLILTLVFVALILMPKPVHANDEMERARAIMVMSMIQQQAAAQAATPNAPLCTCPDGSQCVCVNGQCYCLPAKSGSAAADVFSADNHAVLAVASAPAAGCYESEVGGKTYTLQFGKQYTINGTLYRAMTQDEYNSRDANCQGGQCSVGPLSRGCASCGQAYTSQQPQSYYQYASPGGCSGGSCGSGGCTSCGGGRGRR